MVSYPPGVYALMLRNGTGRLSALLRPTKESKRERTRVSERDMLRSAASKVMWVGRATIFMVDAFRNGQETVSL